jgi:NAD(P)-dependent dehydrogenase (short-subunit alcohol dehydrogenase family)
VRALDVTDHRAVFAVFDEFAATLGGVDRFIVNAGIGRGHPVGTGHFESNLDTVMTNFVAGLAQCEAAVRILREQGHGHLVVISSMSAMRGLPRHLTAYAASKAAIAHLAEGIRADLAATPIVVSTIFPGYIRTEINQRAKKLPFEVDEVTGAEALVRAIEKEPATAWVPAWPWTVVGHVMRVVPARFLV